MARYTDVQDIAFNNLRDSRAVVVDGSVEFAVFNGDSFIADSASPLVTDNYVLYTKGLRILFTPSAGSSYLIEEGEHR
tara:strand:- start:435 stop:668 length:234 start_codon:yes stop_codon:yes gene_type:complete